MQIQCYTDRDGVFRVKVKDTYAALAGFLAQDIEGCVNACRSYLSALEDGNVRRGEQWKASGNAHIVEIHRDKVEIQNLWCRDVPPVTLTVAEFREALETWLACISAAKKSGD